MKKRFGLTLVEVMVGVFLSSLVMGAGYQIFNTSQRKLTKSSTRQLLANEVRVAIKTLAQDFKAVKADSLEVNAANTGNTAIISFDRYMVTGEGDQEQLAFDRFERVVYEFRKPYLIRRVGGNSRTLARHLETLAFARPEAPPAGVPATGEINYDAGWSARMDIEMSGSKKVPGTIEIATHSESVSVFMIEEYYRLVNKNRFLSMSQLAKDAGAKVLDDEFDYDSMFQTNLDPEELAKLTREQLENLKVKENNGLTEAETRLGEINDSISGVDTQGDRLWYTLWLARANTEVTQLQNDLKRHDTAQEIRADIDRIDRTINEYERDNMRDSFSRSNIPIDTMDKNSQEYKDYKDAYDLMLRDRSMRQAHEAGRQDATDEYPSMLDAYNPANMTMGVIRDTQGNDITFTETPDEFQQRRDRAAAMYEKCQQVDLSWMDAKSGEQRVKLYTAAKDLRDLAETKLSYIEQRDAHRKNIEAIDQALPNAAS